MDGFATRIEAIARAQPDRLALVGKDVAVGYAELASRVARLAASLHRQGLVPGTMVGVALPDDVAHVVAMLALLRLGCHQATLASHDPPALRAGIAARLGVTVVLGEDAVPGLPRLDAGDGGGSALPPRPDAAPTVVFTSSGTTGRPKLIPFTEAQMIALSGARTDLGAVRFRPMGVEHNNGKRYALFTLANGETLVLAATARAMGLAEMARRFGIAVLGLTPQLATGLLNGAGQDWPAATRIDLYGAAPGAALVRRLQAEVTRNLSVLYGATETGSVARAGPEALLRDPDSVGPILPNAALRVVDEAGRDLPVGETGLLRIRTIGMATQYLGDEAATSRCFVDGWFQPGDMGCLSPEGTLQVAGRGDDMMILGTLNIFPAEIERAAEGFPGVAECAAFAMRSARHGDIPMLAVVAREGFDAAALLAHCRAALGMRAPRKVVPVASLPRNAAGKVLRRELAAMVREAG